ncbi:MAG: hypothetical protein LCI00_21110 [Chloroflexi bacterium]|nr:hypothetical protein [Chloroflexota bacterium]
MPKMHNILQIRQFQKQLLRFDVNDAVVVVENPLFYVGSVVNVGGEKRVSPSIGGNVVNVGKGSWQYWRQFRQWHIDLSADSANGSGETTAMLAKGLPPPRLLNRFPTFSRAISIRVVAK